MPRTHDTRRITWTKGPLIVNLEPLFVHLQRYPKRRIAPATPPLTETAAPRELDGEFRTGHGRAFRVPLTRRAVVLGYWEPPGDAVLPEEESGKLLAALQGAHIKGITATEIASWSSGAVVLSWWDRLRALVRQWLWHDELVRGDSFDRADGDVGGGWTVTEWDPLADLTIPEGDPVTDLM